MFSILKNKKNEKFDALILGAPFDGSYSFRGGASKGPDEIIKCFADHLEVFDRFTNTQPYYLYDIRYFGLPTLKKMGDIEAVKKIEETYNFFSDKLTILLGGTHTVSIGAFNFFSKKYKPQDVTILQIDAHPDMRDNTNDYKDNGTKYDHACVMRRAVELGFKTVQVGIRTISQFDHDFITKNNLKVFEWGKGATPSINEIINSIKTDKVYLTFDIDGLDPTCAPATGTPIPGGIDWNYSQELIRTLIKEKTIIGADIVEVAPFKDDVLTQYTAASICYNIISYVLLKKDNKLNYV